MDRRRLAGMALTLLCVLASGCERKEPPPAAQPRTEAPVPPSGTGAGLEGVPLEERVREALRSNPQVGTLTVEVRREGDAITLTGNVATDEQREWAGRIARDAAGKASVRNELQVGRTPAAVAPK